MPCIQHTYHPSFVASVAFNWLCQCHCYIASPWRPFLIPSLRLAPTAKNFFRLQCERSFAQAQRNMLLMVIEAGTFDRYMNKITKKKYTNTHKKKEEKNSNIKRHLQIDSKGRQVGELVFLNDRLKGLAGWPTLIGNRSSSTFKHFKNRFEL